MQDRPDNSELLASVEAFLKDEVVPRLPAAEAFRARVSANVLAMVRRDLARYSSDADQDERERLRRLIGKRGTLAGQTAELCRLIASGALTADDRCLRDHLWLTTLAKLAVDQPGYSGYQRALAEWETFKARADPAGPAP